MAPTNLCYNLSPFLGNTYSVFTIAPNICSIILWLFKNLIPKTTDWFYYETFLIDKEVYLTKYSSSSQIDRNIPYWMILVILLVLLPQLDENVWTYLSLLSTIIQSTIILHIQCHLEITLIFRNIVTLFIILYII